MILGASLLQLPAIKKAKEMGLDVIAVDMDPDAVGFKEEGITKLQISTIDTPRIVEAARTYQIDGIMTLASDMPMQAVAAVCEELGLIGITPQTALNATNKAEMRRCFKAHDVPIPEFYIVSELDEFMEATKHFTTKFIIKPADNSGNRGVKLITDIAEEQVLIQAFDYSKKYSRDGRVLLEEYMEGDEFSVETMSVDGVCHVIQVTDKLTSGAPYFVEMGHTQPSMFAEDIKMRISEVAKAGIKALGINHGPSHTEIKLTSTGPKIVEIGARLGGGCITTHLVPLSTGVNMVEANIRIALGETPDLCKKYDKGAAIRFLQPLPGIFKSVEGVDEARGISGVIEVGFMKKIGEVIPELSNGLDRVGYVITQGNTREEAVRLCGQAVKKIKFEMVQIMYKSFFKRLFDICGSLLAIPFVVIIGLFVGLAIYWEDKGDVFYLASRRGRYGKIFKMFKFRSMKMNAPDIRNSDNSTYNSPDDPRVTKVGKFIRRTSIDELPQFFNVLIGDMSFIGPRPVTIDRSFEEYDEKRKIRLDVRPGITGYSQAYFRNSISNEKKLEKDAFYARNVSFWGDLKIILATINTVIFRRNIYNKKNQ